MERIEWLFNMHFSDEKRLSPRSDFRIAEKIGRHLGTPPSDPSLERKRAGRFPGVLERVLSSMENQSVVLERLFEQGRIP